MLLELPDLLTRLNDHRRRGYKIVFTNGCFDIIHAGHVQYLREARDHGDVLVVGINCDATVGKLKGSARPYNKLADRVLVLESLEMVDYVVAFDAPTPIDLIKEVRPDVLVKGADYQGKVVVGADFIRSRGGQVHTVKLRDDLSTTKLVEAIKCGR